MTSLITAQSNVIHLHFSLCLGAAKAKESAGIRRAKQTVIGAFVHHRELHMVKGMLCLPGTLPRKMASSSGQLLYTNTPKQQAIIPGMY